MYTFDQRMGDAVSNSGKKGWLVSILELGAWFGVLVTGYLADKLSRKYTIVLAVIIFCIGVIVQTAAFHPSSIFGGRFITGLGVGSLSMCVPLYKCVLAFRFPLLAINSAIYRDVDNSVLNSPRRRFEDPW